MLFEPRTGGNPSIPSRIGHMGRKSLNDFEGEVVAF
jgi:hypothetical protein